MPLVMDFVNSLYGPQAKEREKRHAGHSWLFPPVIEKLHLLADHFLSSDFGRKIMEMVGAEKIVKIFSDETGKFSYDKFVELMENHSFRRHWIHMLVLRMGKFLEQYSDPKMYEEYLQMGVYMVNGYLRKQGYPKTVTLNMNTPVQSLSSITNFFSEKYLGTKIDSKYYIEPVISYIRQILNMVRQASTSRGGTEGISAKLADSINLEIIEPIARVNRAYRYLKKNPKCDRYVLCLVNQRSPETDSLPGLKLLLSRGTSFVASWALSSLQSGSMMEYFNIIMYEDQCQKYFKPDCSDYHDEEVKVTTEYIHNEL
ncbi:hypothetical protein WA026_022579 [Henosepilachna vigintioctopunctata]|uniref:Uncharacterized protein n=1 Tax=Henosepilachna vigintioctopunctata TaxID=420089 RepID=A0AAW1VDK4_9CUCU